MDALETMIESKHVADLLLPLNLRGDGAAEKSRELTLALLKATKEPFSRQQFTPGHITCTGLVLSPGGEHILLVLHRRLLRWLLPGGHGELSDGAVTDAARREVIEETGIALREDPSPPLVGVDVHPMPARGAEPYHLHHDLIFRFQAESLDCKPSKEIQRLAWSGLDELERYEVPGCIRRAYIRALGPRA